MDSRFNKRVKTFLPFFLILSFAIISVVSLVYIRRMQGDARVINYTGLVRGATQRLIKQEMNYKENDELIAYLDIVIEELRNGGKEYHLIALKDQEYQSLMTQIQKDWEDIKKEIKKIRGGSKQDRLYSMSEEQFKLTDEAVSRAEAYSEEKVKNSIYWLLTLNIVFGFFVLAYWWIGRRQKKIYNAYQAASLANKEKSEFLSRMSHEIRTPMNGIIGMVEIARLHPENKEIISDCLDKIKLSSDYLLSLINDVLDMARIESGKVELCVRPFLLKSLMDRLNTMFLQKAKDKNINYEVHLDETAVSGVVGDELRITQVIVNLVSNAIKFTPPGKSVTVELIQERMVGSTADLKFMVADTGIGIDEKFKAKMFEPFEQASSSTLRQYGGTGLGLAISYNLVKMMGGSISVISELGKGTCFTISLTLPCDVKLPSGSTEEGIQNIEKVNLEGIRILLAEDNEINSEIAVTLLEAYGAKVDHAWNGEEAVKYFMDSQANLYDLILMDIQMPKKNGTQACKLIRESDHPQAKSIIIIGLSANAFQQDKEYAIKAGMNDYVAKPIDIDGLLKKIAGIERQKEDTMQES